MPDPVYSLRLPEEARERLRRYARRAGEPPSVLIRRWVMERLTDEPNEGEWIAQAVATDLRRLFGDRLHRVILFGSWARDEAGDESDVDLLIVLDQVASRHAERKHMYKVIGDHALESGRTISAFPVALGDLERPESPIILRALNEGKDVLADAA